MQKSFIQNKETLKLGSKYDFNFSKRNFRRQFENSIVIFETTTFEFIKSKVACKTKKTLSLGRKMPYLNIFRSEFEDNYYTM